MINTLESLPYSVLIPLLFRKNLNLNYQKNFIFQFREYYILIIIGQIKPRYIQSRGCLPAFPIFFSDHPNVASDDEYRQQGASYHYIV